MVRKNPEKSAALTVWDKFPDGSTLIFGATEHSVGYAEGCLCAENFRARSIQPFRYNTGM